MRRALDRGRRAPCRIERAHHRAHAGADDEVGPHAGGLQRLQHADVCEPAQAAAGQDQRRARSWVVVNHFFAARSAAMRSDVSTSLRKLVMSIVMPFSTVLQWREIAASATASLISSGVAP